jgi:hypothetical protein
MYEGCVKDDETVVSMNERKGGSRAIALGGRKVRIRGMKNGLR